MKRLNPKLKGISCQAAGKTRAERRASEALFLARKFSPQLSGQVSWVNCTSIMQGTRMTFRDHPSMKYRGMPNWPPSYLTQDYRQELLDEFGILRYVAFDPKVPNRCFVTVEMDRLGYVGYLQFDDLTFRWKFFIAIKGHLNKTIRTIGDLEFADL
jgi:hypothetical protein